MSERYVLDGGAVRCRETEIAIECVHQCEAELLRDQLNSYESELLRLRSEVERLTRERDEALAANAPASAGPEGWPDSPVVGELHAELMQARTEHKAAEAELARLRTVVEAAERWCEGESCQCPGGKLDPHLTDCPWQRVEQRLFDATMDALRAADGGDAHAGGA